MIRFSCPGCEATYTVEDSKGGKTGSCPKCKARFTIPFPEGGAAPAPPPLPPPPAPVDPDAPVEIAPCPGCQARLSVTAADLGLEVECPYCQRVYIARRPGGGSAGRRALSEEDEDRPSRRRRDDEEDDDRPRRRRCDEEDEEVDEERPRRRRRDEDDEEERPRSRRRRSRGGEPHRGTLILILGILGWVGCGIFTAIPAWIMGRGDLQQMDAGIMDDEGRSLTQIGMYLGMASCILTLVLLLGYCVIFLIALAAGG